MRADALLSLAKLESIMLELPARVRLGRVCRRRRLG